MIKDIENRLKEVDLSELSNKIKMFRNLNFQCMSEDELRKEIMNVLTFNNRFIFPTNSLVYPKGTEFFRVRRLDGFKIPNKALLQESDFWNCPSKLIKKPGRLNKKGESLLYTAMEPKTALAEVNLNARDFYSLIVYKAKDNVKMNVIGGNYNYKNLEIFDEKAILVIETYNNFLRDEFSRYVSDGSEFLYLISEIIAKDYFDLPPRSVQDAWYYPSVKNKSKYNACFRPEIAKDLLELRGAMICKKTNDSEIKVIAVTPGSINNQIPILYPIGSKEQKNIFPEIL